jgi:autotransporter-associated beta strand protein
MSFSKTVFLSSLACFSLGLGSLKADFYVNCNDGNQNDGSCCREATDCSGDCDKSNFRTAIKCVNNTEGGNIVFNVSDTARAQTGTKSPGYATNISSIYPGGTALRARDDYVFLLTVDHGADQAFITIGPEGSEPISFSSEEGVATNMSLGAGVLAFGPQCTLPASESDLALILLDGGATLSFEQSGTMGSYIDLSGSGVLSLGTDVAISMTGRLETNGHYLSIRGGGSSYSSISFDNQSTKQQIQNGEFKYCTVVAKESFDGNGTITMTDAILGLDGSFTFTGTDLVLVGSSGIDGPLVDQSVVFSGNLSGDSFFKWGYGTLEFTGTCSYTGGTSIAGGRLNIGSSSGIGSGSVSLSEDTTLGFLVSATLNGAINLAQGSTVAVENGSAVTINGNIDVAGSEMVVSDGASVTINGNLTGSEGLSIYGGGSFLYNGDSANFTGGLSFTDVDFALQSTNAVNANTDLSINRCALILNNLSVTIGDISGSQASIDLGSGILTINQTSSSKTLDATITGSGGMNYQNGSGSGRNVSLRITGDVSYTGTTTIGPYVTVSIENDSDLGNGGQLTMQGPCELKLEINSIRTDRAFNLASDICTINLEDKVSLEVAGLITGTGDLYLTRSSSGATFTPSNASNTFTGDVTVDDITLVLSSPGALGGSSLLNLQAGTVEIKSTMTLGQDILLDSGGGEFSVLSGTTLTLEGAIGDVSSRAGSLDLIGSGTTVLSGTSTFTGGTLVTAGTLQVAADANLGDTSGDITLQGASSYSVPTLVVTESVNFARKLSIQDYGGKIDTGANTVSFTSLSLESSQKAVLTKLGAGSLSILPTSGKNTPQVGITVSEGTLTANTYLLEDASICLAAGTSLIFSQSLEGSYYGDNNGNTISGEGSLTIDGAATLNFLVPTESSSKQLASTFTGGITLTRGTLAVSADTFTSKGSTKYALGDAGVPITCNGGEFKTVVIDGTSYNLVSSDRPFTLNVDTRFNTENICSDSNPCYSDLELNGVVSGSGGITKIGDAVLYLKADNTYTGETVVQEGTLSVDGSIVGNVTVESGGCLKGSGEIGGDVTTEEDSCVAAGNSIGKLTIHKDLFIGSGASFFVEISPSDASSLLVQGGATLEDGALLIVIPQPHEYSTDLLYTVITTEDGHTGTFSKVKANPLFFLETAVIYDPLDILLSISPKDTSSLVVGNNALAVAKALDEVINWNRENVRLTIPIRNSIDNALLPEVFASLFDLQTEELMTPAMDNLHSAPLKNLVISQENASIQVQESLSQRLNNEINTLDCAITKRSYTFWMNGMGNALNQNNKQYKGSPQAGYNSNMAGFVAGADYRFFDYLYAGALGGFTSSHVNLHKDRGTGDINTGYFGLYLSAAHELFYGNLSVTGGWSGYSANRHIQYTGVDLIAENDHGGRQMLTHLDLGLNLPLGRFNIRPFDRFDYLTQTEYEYNETKAGEWNLHVNKNTSILIRNELGLQFASCFPFNGGRITVLPKFSWVREVRVKGSTYKASFTGAEDFPFTVTGYFPDRSLFSPGVMITGALLEDKLSLSAYYDGEFVSGYSAHRYGAELKYSF